MSSFSYRTYLDMSFDEPVQLEVFVVFAVGVYIEVESVASIFGRTSEKEEAASAQCSLHKRGVYISHGIYRLVDHSQVPWLGIRRTSETSVERTFIQR